MFDYETRGMLADMFHSLIEEAEKEMVLAYKASLYKKDQKVINDHLYKMENALNYFEEKTSDELELTEIVDKTNPISEKAAEWAQEALYG